MNCLNNLSVEDGAEVGAQEIAGEGVGVFLPLVGAPDKPSMSSSSPPGGELREKLRQVRGPAIAKSKGENFFFQTGWLTCCV